MKKIIFSIIFLLLISGCKQKFQIENDIININYNKYSLEPDDYQQVIDSLSELTFSCVKNKKYNNSIFSISTTDRVINFNLSTNYYMEYQENNKYCYTKESEKVKNLFFLLNGLVDKYTNTNFYVIEYVNNYSEDNKDINIRLDKSDEYVIIDTNEQITNFKINEIEFKDDYYEEINLLYQKDIIGPNRIVIRYSIEELPNYKISFTNKYGYTFNIIPTYDGITGKIIFETEVK